MQYERAICMRFTGRAVVNRMQIGRNFTNDDISRLHILTSVFKRYVNLRISPSGLYTACINVFTIYASERTWKEF